MQGLIEVHVNTTANYGYLYAGMQKHKCMQLIKAYTLY